MQQDLEGLALLLAGEGVRREDGGEHQGDDEEERRQKVAVDESDEPFARRQVEDGLGQPAGEGAQHLRDVGRVGVARRQPHAEGKDDE